MPGFPHGRRPTCARSALTMRRVTRKGGDRDILYGGTPFGWRLTQDRSRLVRDVEEQRVLSAVRRMYLVERLPMRDIVERLREMGVANRRGPALQHEQRVGDDSPPQRATLRGEAIKLAAREEGSEASERRVSRGVAQVW
jgi:hypothetical protein